MKKLLLLSLVLNSLLVGFIIKSRLDQSRTINAAALNEKRLMDVKAEIQANLPLDTTSVVFVGNSLTERFPVAEFFPSAPVKNRGIGFSTSQNILDRVKPIACANPKKVFLAVGINDILQNIQLDTLKTHFEKIAVQFQKGLYVQSVLPTGDVEKNKVIVSFNTYLKNYCASHSIPFVNLYHHFLSGDTLNPAYTFDGVHLTFAGYKEWAALLSPVINN